VETSYLGVLPWNPLYICTPFGTSQALLGQSAYRVRSSVLTLCHLNCLPNSARFDIIYIVIGQLVKFVQFDINYVVIGQFVKFVSI
jgi:hypothetical protein